MHIRGLVAALAAGVLGAAAHAASVAASSPRLPGDVMAVRDRALSDSTAWDVLESLTTEVGARPVGTEAMDRARDWAVAKLGALGFVNVKVETFTTPAWIRGPLESAEVISPWPHRLQILAIGGSSPTPAGGLTAPIFLFKTYQELLDQPIGSLGGKIAVVTQRMPLLHGYGSVWSMRAEGAAEAAKRGAVGYMFRSLSTSDSRLPHTGAGKEAGIPAVALSPPDAELLERLAARHKPISVRLVTTSELNPHAAAYNISGEIPGSTDGIVLVSGHLDSWDPGTGAEDDGAGVAISIAAAKLATSVGGRPTRTVRVVLWGSSEQGGSSAAYIASHRDEVPKIIVQGESDSGSEAPYVTAVPAGSLHSSEMRAYAAAIPGLRMAMSDTPAINDGSDTEGLADSGTPAVTITNQVSRFMTLHHSADDTLDKVDPGTLALNVAAWASFVHAVAYGDVDFRKLAAAAH